MTDTTHDDLVKRICEEWVKDGRSDDCFWEGWPECPTPEDSLTPRMVLDRIEELEAERDALAYERNEELEAKLAQQDDLVQAAVAAALREAVAAIKKDADNDDISSGAAQWVSDTILALITDDAQAALDRVVAAERERCAEQAESHKPSKSLLSERYWRGVDEAAHSIAVAIREGGE